EARHMRIRCDCAVAWFFKSFEFGRLDCLDLFGRVRDWGSGELFGGLLRRRYYWFRCVSGRGFVFAQPNGDGDQVCDVKGVAAAVLDLADPGGEACVREVDERAQIARDWPFELEPAVERLFDFPRAFAEVAQADHAAAAFEGVE